MGSVEFERIKARDGHDLPVWLTRPAGTTAKQALPAVVLVHGGPWVRQGSWRWDPMAQFLASRGYLVLEPEFRGSDGYGLKHLNAGNRQWGQAMQDDVSDVLLWARQQGLANDKACIAGSSYGGYSTLMGLIKNPELFRCGSASFAVTDLMLMVKGSWWVEDDVSDATRKHSLPERVGDPVKDQEMLLAQSPVTQAHRLRAPLQLMWGDEDKRVPLTHGHRLRSEMRKAGLEPEWVVYEGEGHGLRKLENRTDMARRLESFLARHLK
jgi:dipeptidyl aminopeptidase/acylaminoacyl peptidase